MGGDGVSVFCSSTEEESTTDQEFPEQPHGLSIPHEGCAFDPKVEKGESGSVHEQMRDDYRRISWNAVAFEANQRRKVNMYAEVLKCYTDVQHRIEQMEEAKRKILSYTPGSWIEKNGTPMSNYDVPKTTSLLLIGPKGSGKSSLVNKLSRMFEDDMFAPDRAQVSYNSYVGGGTYFVQEYMIPRGSDSFCVYDTRSLSDELTENMKELECWMTKGIRHGELVMRYTDSKSFIKRMYHKARQHGRYSGETRMVNFVIFVLNGLSVLEAMVNDDEIKKQYTERIAATFKNPMLSFKDDKPAIVVTHGDLLSVSDRVRVRIYLGELLGVPPHRQIFDIPESDNLMDKLAVVDMLRYSLEHADRNLPSKGRFLGKIRRASPSACMFQLMLLVIIFVFACIAGAHSHRSPTELTPPPPTLLDWSAMRHLWLGVDYD